MNEDRVRFIIITVPPDDVAGEINTFRRRVSEVGNAREALKYPPHVTMRTGALVPRGEVDSFTDRFVRHLTGIQPFRMETNTLHQGIYASEDETRNFVGYGIDPSPELTSLHGRLLELVEYRKNAHRNSNPHLTIAFHDLSVDGAARVARWIEDNSDSVPAGFSWTCGNVGLYRLLDGRWELFREARF